MRLPELAEKFVQKVANKIAPQTWQPPGHFMSPIVDPEELKRRFDAVFHDNDPLGIDLNTDGQLAMVDRLKRHYASLPFGEEKRDGIRYTYKAGNFGYGDGVTLGCMLLDLKPKRYLEFGAGNSSCVALDVRDSAGLDMACTFIDPYPWRIKSLLENQKPANFQLIESAAQDIDVALIDELEAGDVLFIDSTHVSKGGSDVNFHMFNCLPRLKSGVYIHFHDMFFPFEYPPEWFFEGNRSWNELYLVRAFLMHNTAYEIILFNQYLYKKHPDVMRQALPIFMTHPGGGLWLRKR
jgi:hypothetical protein